MEASCKELSFLTKSAVQDYLSRVATPVHLVLLGECIICTFGKFASGINSLKDVKCLFKVKMNKIKITSKYVNASV